MQDKGSVETHTVAEILIPEAQAQKKGAKVLTSSVSGFVEENKTASRSVTTSDGTIQGDHVVLAAGLGGVPNPC